MFLLIILVSVILKLSVAKISGYDISVFLFVKQFGLSVKLHKFNIFFNSFLNSELFLFNYHYEISIHLIFHQMYFHDISQ